MRRAYLLSLITVAVILFLVVSAVLARVFSVDGAERSAVTNLIEAEAKGNSSAMLDAIKACRASSACRGRVAADIARLQHAGNVAILQLTTSAGFSLTSTVGTARVAWSVNLSLPIVQCVRVRRAGNALSGLHIELLAISRRIKTDADCPARF